MITQPTCSFCGEPIVGRQSNAHLCFSCATGHKRRKCDLCGKPFRSVHARRCPTCRRILIRRAALLREAAKRVLRETENGLKPPKTPPSEAIESVLTPAAAEVAATLTRDGILAIRQRLSMSQPEFGKALGTGRNWPYSAAYISKLEAGKLPITDAIRHAIARLGTGTAHLRILPRACYATTDLPAGTVILGQPVVDPICGGVFIMPYASQRYCSRACRNEARRRRRYEKEGQQ